MSGTKIFLNNGAELLVSSPLSEVTDAVANGGWVHINGVDGHGVAVNSGLVAYLKEVNIDETEVVPSVTGSATRQLA